MADRKPKGQCLLAETAASATRKRRQIFQKRRSVPHGSTVIAGCGNDLCCAALHARLRRWKSWGGKWARVAAEVRALPVGGILYLHCEPADAASVRRARSGITTLAGNMKVSVRSSGRPTGIAVVHRGFWERAIPATGTGV